MIYVRKVGATWQRWDGSSAIFTRMVDEAVLQRHDGTEQTVKVDPYPMEVQLSATPALALWSDEELAAVGLCRAAPFMVPEGQVTVGEPRYEQQADGSVAEVYDTEAAPPPPADPTAAERLAASGLTVDELKQLLGLE